MKNSSDKSCRENQNTHFVFSNFFFCENLAVYEIQVEKYFRTGQATDDSTVHALCMLDT
jgi:mannose-6-phosphate isomerase-like protein (cupin superfamily)